MAFGAQLAACDSAGTPEGPGPPTAGEEAALEKAAAMLEERPEPSPAHGDQVGPASKDGNQ